MVKPLSEQLSDLSVHAKKAEDDVAAAKGLPGDWGCQAAKAACGSGSLAGWNLCPKPEPSVPL